MRRRRGTRQPTETKSDGSNCRRKYTTSLRSIVCPTTAFSSPCGAPGKGNHSSIRFPVCARLSLMRVIALKWSDGIPINSGTKKLPMWLARWASKRRQEWPGILRFVLPNCTVMNPRKKTQRERWGSVKCHMNTQHTFQLRINMPAMMPVGSIFSCYTTISIPFSRVFSGNKRRWMVKVRCACGTERDIICGSLLNGHSRSCGCSFNGKHKESRTRLYDTWAGIKERCYSPNHKGYRLYGGRGITMCDEWQGNYMAFREWALSNGWKHGLQIDRMDNDGPYSPGNCRVATRKQQSRNRRTNKLITAFGETKCLAEWAEDPRCAVCPVAFQQRIRKGWEVTRALTTPRVPKKLLRAMKGGVFRDLSKVQG
jgi:hypothetical protein